MTGPSIEDEILCRCSDPMWLIQLFIGGDLADELLVDTSIDNAQVIAEEARDKHWAMAMDASLESKHWRVKMTCPHCGAGTLADSAYGPMRIEPNSKPSMLHILLRATGNEEGRGPIITATCGCACVASPPTHEKFKDEDFMHVTYCLPCWGREHD